MTKENVQAIETEKTLKKHWKRFCGVLKEDIKTESSDFKYISLKFLIIALSTIISLFWAPFAFVVLLEAIVFSCFQLDGKALYYLVFMMPFMQIFRYKPSDTYFLMYVVVAVLLTLGIKLIIDLIKKEKKIEWFFTIVFAILLIYVSLPRNNGKEALRFWGSLVLGLGIVFVARYYKKDINLKELVFSFVLGFLLACFMGVFRNISRIPTMVGKFYSYGKRLTATYINPNVLMGEGSICLALVMILFLKKKINIIFYPLLMTITPLILFTKSKVGLVIVCVTFILFLIMMFARKLSKKQLIINLAVILTMIITLGICYKEPIEQILGRLSDSLTGGQAGENLDNSIIFGNTDINLTELSTGRFNIWISYLKASTKSVKTLLFGYGVGAPFIGEWQGWNGWQPHNTFIQALYYVGVVGILLFVLLFISILNKKNIKNFNIYSLLVIFVTGLYLCDLEFFSFRLGVYAILICYALVKEHEDIKEETLNEKRKEIIPRKIHYIWIGNNPLPETMKKCIESWKQMCPDYEIVKWDETNLNIDCCKYCRQAYDAKKYAFASDVLRFDILYKEGGIYLDVDVKLIKPLDDLLNQQCFMGFEHKEALNPGLILGAQKSCKTIKELFDSYKKDNFIMDDGSFNLNTICVRTTKYLLEKGMKLDNSRQKVADVDIYPSQYFCPINPITNKVEISKETIGVHLYYASWFSKKAKLKKNVKKFLNFVTNGWFGIWLYRLKK